MEYRTFVNCTGKKEENFTKTLEYYHLYIKHRLFYAVHKPKNTPTLETPLNKYFCIKKKDEFLKLNPSIINSETVMKELSQ